MNRSSAAENTVNSITSAPAWNTSASPATNNISRAVAVLFFIVAAYMLYQVYLHIPANRSYQGNDINYIWNDGNDIANGVNPYSTIHGGDMRHNQKYSTYFPGFFLLVSVTVLAGIKSLAAFMVYWRVAELVLVWCGGIVVYRMIRKETSILPSLFGAGFFMFNRWTLNVMNSGQIDVAAILFLLLSLSCFHTNRIGSLLLFGTSLAIKQIGIFMLPLYLIYLWEDTRPVKDNLREACKQLAWIALIPGLLTVPFLIWDAKGFILSVFFSATRIAGGHFRADSIDTLMGFEGFRARLGMLALMGCVYLYAWQRDIRKFTAGLLIYLVFMGFNSILFKQYMAWFVPFVPLALLELKQLARSREHTA